MASKIETDYSKNIPADIKGGLGLGVQPSYYVSAELGREMRFGVGHTKYDGTDAYDAFVDSTHTDSEKFFHKFTLGFLGDRDVFFPEYVKKIEQVFGVIQDSTAVTDAQLMSIGRIVTPRQLDLFHATARGFANGIAQAAIEKEDIETAIRAFDLGTEGGLRNNKDLQEIIMEFAREHFTAHPKLWQIAELLAAVTQAPPATEASHYFLDHLVMGK